MVSHGAPLKTVKSFWEIAVGEQELYLKYEDIGSPNKLINHPLFEPARTYCAVLFKEAKFLVFILIHLLANIMKVGCRPIISTFRIELSPTPPCIVALKTEMFGTFIFKDAQATESRCWGHVLVLVPASPFIPGPDDQFIWLSWELSGHAFKLFVLIACG